jgi:hypothetical protein
MITGMALFYAIFCKLYILDLYRVKGESMGGTLKK